MNQPMLKAGELLKALQKHDFYIVCQKGSHIRLKHKDGRVTSIPYHSGVAIMGLSPIAIFLHGN